jgi:Aspartyl protease
MRTILAAVALTTGVTISGAAQAADCSALQIENSVKMVPLGRTDRALVPITLNGVEKKFLFDTGGAISTISAATAKELGLPLYHSRYRLSTLQRQDSWEFVQVHEVILGTAKNNGVQLQVVDHFGSPGGPEPFDGILATGLFVHDDIDMDFGAERLNFFSTDHCEGKVVYWPHQVLSVVPVTEEQSHLDVPVTLDGHPLRAMIDTGAARTTMDLSRARQVINFSPDAPATGNAPKDNPERQIYPRRFSTLSFDGVTVQNPLVIIQPLQFGGGKTDDATLGSRAERKDDQANRLSADITIGMDVLRHLHVYFASRESKLYITEATAGESVLFKTAAPSPVP